MDNTNKVFEHASFFADEDGQLTKDHMIACHEKIGIKDSALKATAIKSLLKRNGCPYTAKAISGIANPASTGIWNTDGTFNEQVFQKLTARAVRDNNDKPAITRQMFDDILLSDKTNDGKPGSSNIAAYAWLFSVIPIPLTWSRITQASLDELFKYFHDTYVGEDPGITVEHLRDFYTKPKAFLDKYVERH